MIFEANNIADEKYNFMLYNQLVNELSAESKSVVLIKYGSRLYTVDIFIQELVDIIFNDFSDRKLSIISHGPQAGVEAVLLSDHLKVDSIKLICRGLGVGEYYVECIEQIIKENKLSLPWDKKILRQQENAIKNIRTHLQCCNCSLIKSSSTFETYCHGFCGKNISQYFGSLVEYSTDQIMEMIGKADCNVSIVWPEYSIGPWKQHYDEWSNISNVEMQIIDNCYETLRKPGIKEKKSYSNILLFKNQFYWMEDIVGTKLCNLNIYNPEKKPYELEAGYSVVHIADGWDTILEDEMVLNYNKMARIARRLSKELNSPAITVNYFDDDVFILDITKDGKKAAYHVVKYDNSISKKIPIIIEALRLDDKDAKIFKHIMRNEKEAPKAIDKLSAICGVPFYVDMMIFKETKGPFIPDKAAVIEEIKRKKINYKNKSQKAELLKEFPGAVVKYYTIPSNSDNYTGIIRTVEPDENELDYGKVHCYQVADGQVPTLRKVHDYYIPIHEYTKQPKNTNVWITKVDFLKGAALHMTEPPFWGLYDTSDKDTINKILGSGIIPEENLSNSTYCFADEVSKVDMKLFPKEPNKELAESVIKENKCINYFAWAIKKIDDVIIRVSSYFEQSIGKFETFARFDFWNEDHVLIETKLVPTEYGDNFPFTDSDFTYIKERQEIVYGHCIYNLKEKTVSKNLKFPEKNTFIEKRVINGKNCLIVGTSRYIQIYDYDLNLLKAYSLFGKYFKWFYDDEDNMYVITSSMIHGTESRGMNAKDKVRMYKIELSKL
ncbi:hypothetical protein [Butyrivibrio fibrisolvens]|nr:hypothetical protein [Butyrivibrio fibrisolvens]